jgi:hypothetical protein
MDVALARRYHHLPPCQLAANITASASASINDPTNSSDPTEHDCSIPVRRHDNRVVRMSEDAARVDLQHQRSRPRHAHVADARVQMVAHAVPLVAAVAW